MMTTKPIAEQLFELRCALSITQEKAAAIMGVDRYTYWRYEHGKAEPKAVNFQKLQNAAKEKKQKE
jgi:transcriptional regulator with XRE-family HTH domain